MAKPVTTETLRRWADELDAEERDELSKAQQEKIDELAASERLTGDEIAWLRGLKERLEADEGEEEEPEAPAELEPKGEPEAKRRRPAKPKDEEEEEEGPSRPGRRSGELYKWDVDADGNVRPLDIPKLYTGEDEPERVPLPEEEAEAV